MKTSHAIPSSLGDYIRVRRTELQISQRGLAKKIGLNAPSHLSDVENGFRQLGESYLPALAAALEVTEDELLKHDPRAPLSEAKELFESDPRYIVALHRVVKAAKRGMQPNELIKAVEDNLPPHPTQNPQTHKNESEVP